MTMNVITTQGALLFLHAQTPMHPGSGTALETVDLPVQRERHTQWPLVPGSSLKGILRDACRRSVAQDNGGDSKKADGDPGLQAVFGPSMGEDARHHAGALAATDARLLAFPVRSLAGVFGWVTCPAILARLRRDLALSGIRATWEIPEVAEDECLVAEGSPLCAGEQVVLEEYALRARPGAQPIAEWIANQAIRDGEEFAPTRKRVARSTLIVSDDLLTWFARHATEVAARIGLDYEKKTVSRGALFYQEFLPAETLFYAVLLAEPSRDPDTRLDARQILEFVGNRLPPILQIGGDETIGKGFTAVRLVTGGGN